MVPHPETSWCQMTVPHDTSLFKDTSDRTQAVTGSVAASRAAAARPLAEGRPAKDTKGAARHNPSNREL